MVAWVAPALYADLGHQDPRLERLKEESSARRAQLYRLKSELRSVDRESFLGALSNLIALDGPGLLDLWQAALENPDLELRRIAWDQYRPLWPKLARRELVAQVVRINAPPDQVMRLASAASLEITIWAELNGQTIAAAPPIWLDQLRRAGLDLTVLYDTIADWQARRAASDPLAEQIAPEHERATKHEIRIAVIDLKGELRPAAGHSDWLGDGENILIANGSFLAYLDVFDSDGSMASINARISERYTKRGYKLAGFFTPEEFSRSIERFFPGESFRIEAASSEGAFHSYQEALDEFAQLARAKPDIAELVNLGPSYEGRQIFALRIGRPAKPEVLITGCHHAREWISVEVPIYIARRLIEDSSKDDSIRYLVENLQIWIVPIVNPDGLNYSQGSANDQFDPIRMWRKNRRPISVLGCQAGLGVDLNRNYGYQWRLPQDRPCPNYFDDVGGSDDPADETYRGPAPESEPEIRALKALIDDPSHNFRARIDYHNFTQLILYPWGHQASPTEDANTLSSLAGRMSDLIGEVDGRIYRPQQAIRLYITTGSSIDYAYAINRVPAPFVVELRPDCCSFAVPESDIEPVCRENWPAAKAILDWACGPPFLQSVRAYQLGSDGQFSRLVYSARWVEEGDSRRMNVELRFPRLEPGRLQLWLQFSKPMDTSSDPEAGLGRIEPFNELRIERAGGWQKTVYSGDTWVGEAVIPEGSDPAREWRLAVSARDLFPFRLDAKPQTRASYAIGTDNWQNYEDWNGAPGGGTDLNHALPPTLRADEVNIIVGAPVAGERLAGGDAYTVKWAVSKNPNFIPLDQELLISTDGGISFGRIASGISGSADRFTILLPMTQTTDARLRVLVREGRFGNASFGDSPPFAIGGDVGSRINLELISSELIEQSWSDAGVGGSAQLIIRVRVVNGGGAIVAKPFLRIEELTRGNILLSRDINSAPSVGARQSVGAGEDNLSPGGSTDVTLRIGLVSRKKFFLSASVYGVVASGAAGPAGPKTLWRGKPRTTGPSSSPQGYNPPNILDSPG